MKGRRDKGERGRERERERGESEEEERERDREGERVLLVYCKCWLSHAYLKLYYR